jgi:O-antigen chain-terminating methyltransferase
MTDDLEQPRLDADKRYNDALTALDRVIVNATRLAELSREDAAAIGTALLVFLQQITAFVDTKDRALTAQFAARLDEHQRSLDAIAELRTHIAVLRREVASRKSQVASQPSPVPSPQPPATDVVYVAFEDRFRGSPDDIREKLRAYLPLFAGRTDVVDLGCGRGEFLDLLKQAGVPARGVDVNGEMAADARGRGLDAVEGDALAYVSARPEASLGGLFAAQVVEHLEPSYLIRLLATGFQKLRPGSPIVLETINPACWLAFFSSYLRDFTHVRPIHPETLQYLLQASGFERVTIRYSAPVPEHTKMQAVHLPAETLAAADPASRAVVGVANAVNANAAILNSLLFTHLDYAAIGYRS